jgi:hypothetical protein
MSNSAHFQKIIDFLENYNEPFWEEVTIYLVDRGEQNKLEYENYNTTKEEVEHTLLINKLWEIKKREEERQQKEIIKAYEDRFKVPMFSKKKDLEDLKKKVTKMISEYDTKYNETGRENPFLEYFVDELSERRRNILKRLKTWKKPNKDFGSDLQRAKAHPIENLIEFNNAGFAECPFHGPERTPSFKLYKDRNKAHCFGCGMDADTIDVYMKLNDCNINEAIKKLR